MAEVVVVGADRLAATTAAAVRRLADLDHSEAGQIIADAATLAAPRRTGAMAGAHTVTIEPGGVRVTNGVRYAIPQHQGWEGNAGRPWLATAAERTEARWLASLEGETQQILDTIQGA